MQKAAMTPSGRKAVSKLWLGFFILCSFFSTALFATDGLQLFVKECSHCHSVAEVASSRVGPSLFGIVGKSVAATDDYVYSQAIRDLGEQGAQWDAATLDGFLASPGDVTPGTKMYYRGMSDPANRAALIDWLAEPDASKLPQEPSVGNGPLKEKIEGILALSADADYGEYLAGECQTCHIDTSTSGAVPPIKGLPAHYFLKALLEYKSGTRDNQVMKLMAGNLGDEELGALAAFFSTPAQ